MEHRHIIKNLNHILVWIKSLVNEVFRLPQGVGGRVEGTDTIFFWPTKIYLKNMERCDVWEDSCVLPSPKVWPASHLPHTWRKPNQINKGGQHTNSRYDNGKIIIQHYYFNPIGALHMLQHQEFLSWRSHVMLWIYSPSNHHHTGGNNNTIQPQSYG